MSQAVLDASAVLALMLGEPGADKVAAVLPDALISTVNVAEVVSKIVERDTSAHTKAYHAIQDLGIEMVDFDADQALVCGALRWLTRDHGLSLGDRACLALGKVRNLPILTADRAWLKVAEPALVRVISIRD